MSMNGVFKRIFIVMLTIAISLLMSCIPQKRLILMQTKEVNDSTYARNFKGIDFGETTYTIQTDDYLYIEITSIDKKITEFFQPLTAINYITATNQALTGYRVEKDGTINLPYIGPVFVRGQTLKEVHETIKKVTDKYVDSARIEVKLINNTITVMGEVVQQGQFRLTKDKVAIFEAVGLAEGFTGYAKRNQVKVLRKEKGEWKLYIVDMNSGKLIGQRMFYVYPNDIVYVEPMKAKAIGLTPTFSLTILTTIITFFILIQSISSN